MENTRVFENLFKRKLSDTGTVFFLEEIAREHPYFSPAQFFLLHKTETGTAEQKKIAARAGLLFNNPHWLNHQLHQTGLPVKKKPLEPITASSHPDTNQTEHMPHQPIPEHTGDNELHEVLINDEMNHSGIHGTGSNLPDQTPATPMPENTDNNDDDAIIEKEIEPFKPMLENINNPSDNSSELPIFEPMHLVDYFASQGIKLSNEVPENDKLGKQLRSFTEWLKTMKKVHYGAMSASQEPGAGQVGGITDASIQALAENSNKEGEVLTEAMAEVLVKQGKPEKAGEVYRKLSLLDPSKFAYFAAKIEQLKSN